MFGDHVLILFDIRSRAVVKETSMRRDWRHYNKDALKSHFELVNWSMDYDCVQSYWNAFEDELIKVVDKVAPLVQFVNSYIRQRPPISIKNKMFYRGLIQTNRLTSIQYRIFRGYGWC